jgi:hypothetical protein
MYSDWYILYVLCRLATSGVGVELNTIKPIVVHTVPPDDDKKVP